MKFKFLPRFILIEIRSLELRHFDFDFFFFFKQIIIWFIILLKLVINLLSIKNYIHSTINKEWYKCYFVFFFTRSVGRSLSFLVDVNNYNYNCSLLSRAVCDHSTIHV